MTILWPGPGRMALVLLAVVPAAMGYPWGSTRERWLLGIAAAVVIGVLGWWRGLHFTTILRRRLAMLRRWPVPVPGTEARTTALLRIDSPATNPDVLPLPLIAGYLNRYGIRADTIRITSRDTGSGRETWLGLTVSAADNLAALRARSARIPLQETAQAAARRLADHLRELGWAVSIAGPDDIPPLAAPDARETWRGLRDGAADYVAAYGVSVDDALPATLAAVRSYPVREVWTALEIGDGRTGRTVAAACALRTDARPGAVAELAGLTPQHGNHRRALIALEPLSARRLGGHTDQRGDLLARLHWPAVNLAATRT